MDIDGRSETGPCIALFDVEDRALGLATWAHRYVNAAYRDTPLFPSRLSPCGAIDRTASWGER